MKRVTKRGYSVDDAEELARVTALFTTVGDNMTADDASSYLISTLQGFHIAAEDAESVIDKYNEVANNFAIDTAGIGEALQRSAASFNAANTDLSKSIALITATNTVVQDPTSVGTLWKTMSARIRGAKNELIEMGEEEETIVESTSKLRDMIKGMTGFDIMKDENTFKDIYEIVLGIGKEWKNLTDLEQAGLGEALAGKRNANALYAVLNNIDTLEAAYKTAEDASGSAMREQENYAQSIQYSIDRVKASLEELAYDTINSGFIKDVIEGANTILQTLDKIVETAGGLPGILSAAAGAFMGLKGGGINFDIDSFGNFSTSILGKKIGGAFKKSEIDLVSNFFDILNDESKVADLLSESMDDLSDSTRLYVQEQIKLGRSGNEIVASMQKANSATGILSSSLKSLGLTIASVAASMLAMFAIQEIVKFVYQLATATDTLKNKASGLGKTFTDTKSDLSSYKKEIRNIYDNILNSDTSTIEERKDARKRLLEIQDEMIAKYGEEKGAIDLIIESVNGETRAIDDLIKSKWKNMLLDIEDPGGDNAISRFLNVLVNDANLALNGVDSNLELIEKHLRDAEYKFTPIYEPTGFGSFDWEHPIESWDNLILDNPHKEKDLEVAEKLAQKYKDIFSYEDGTFSLKGNLQEISDNYDELRKNAKSYGASDTFLSLLDKQAVLAKSDLASLQDVIDASTQMLFANNPAYQNALDKVTEAGESYRKALDEGFKEGNEEELLNEWSEAILDAKNLVQDPYAQNYLDTLNPDIQAKADLQNFKNLYEKNLTGLQDEINNILLEFKNANDGEEFSLEDFLNFNTDRIWENDEDQLYQKLKDIAERNNISIRELINYLGEQGKLKTDLYQELSKVYGEEFVSTLKPEQLEILDSNEFKEYLEGEKRQYVQTAKNTLQDANKEIEKEKQKISDWGLGDFKDDILNDTIQHQFGNVDMDNRSIIKWNEQYLKQWEDALKSWNTYDEAGNIIGNKFTEIQEAIENGEQQIDTVFGGSDTFKLEDRKIEVAYSPIMVDDNGNVIDFLSKENVTNYINQILEQADKAVTESGEEWSEEAVYKKALEIDLTQGMAVEEYDAQGNVVGSHFVKGIIAAIENYTGEGGSAIDAALVGMLMHFIGKYGAVEIATDDATSAQIRYNNAAADGANDLDFLSNVLDKYEKKLRDTQSAQTKFDQKGFAGSIAKAQKLSTLYQNWVEQVEGEKPKIQLDITDVEGLREDFQPIVTEDVFNDFQRIVTDANSTKEQVQSAFDSMITTFINKEIELGGATSQTASSILTQIQDLGLLSDETKELVNTLILRKEVEEEVQSVVESAGDASDLRVQQLASEAEQLGITKEALLNYILQMITASDLQLGGDDSWLIQLCKDLGIAVEAIDAYKAALNSASGGTMSEKISSLQSQQNNAAASGNTAEVQRLAEAQALLTGKSKETAKATDDLTTSFDYNAAAAKIAGKSSGGGGGGGGSAADGFDDAADAADDATNAISDLTDAYQKLKKIMDSYNKTGKISVDQAQELMQMDFRYLNMLKNENGALSLNSQAFENATKAKLSEMRVTMMRNALNTMQSITTEAQAEAYLAVCTGEANMAATEAVAIQAALEQQMRGATGAIAEAYNVIYQGLQNAMALLGGEGFANVDFSGLTEAAGDASGEMAEGAQQEFEKVYDWLERRMKVLQKEADLYAAKRANADKTYYSRSDGANYWFNQEIKTQKKRLETAKEQVKVYGEEYKKAIEGLDQDIIDGIEGNGHSIQTITDQAMSEAIDKAIEWKDKLDDAKISVEEIQTKIGDLAVEKIEYLGEVFERFTLKVRHFLDFSDFNISAMESHGYSPTPAMYKQQAKNYKKLAYKEGKKADRMEAKRQQLIEAGTLIKNSEQDLKLQEEIYEVEQARLEAMEKQAEAEKSARDAARERLEMRHSIVKSYDDELQSIYELYNQDAAIDDKAHYTDTAYGMVATQTYSYKENIAEVARYKKELANLEKRYQDGKIGAAEYREQEQNLRNGMYESAEAAKSAKDAIVDLAKERIEKEIDIIEEQIKAYQDLIKKQQEALKSQKDLHDYQKSVAESQKDIYKITRKLAAIENDNSQSAIAKRKQLEEELAEAREKLEDKQYNHSMDVADKALSAQAEAYEEAKNKEIERLQEKLKNVDLLFSETVNGLNGHMEEAMSSMTSMLGEYGVAMSDTISSAMMTGIEKGSTGVGQYLQNLIAELNEYDIKTKEEEARQLKVQEKEEYFTKLATEQGDLKNKIAVLESKNIISTKTGDNWIQAYDKDNPNGTKYSLNQINNLYKQGKYNEALEALEQLIYHMTKKKKGKSASAQKDIDNLISAVRSWGKKIEKAKKKFSKYAGGVRTLKKDEIAWTQEYGDEAILSPTRNAILTPLKAGDTVLTKAQTENLYKMAQDPQEFMRSVMNVNKVKTNNVGSVTLSIGNVLSVQGDVNDSNAREMAAVAQKAITKAFNELNSKIKK